MTRETFSKRQGDPLSGRNIVKSGLSPRGSRNSDPDPEPRLSFLDWGNGCVCFVRLCHLMVFYIVFRESVSMLAWLHRFRFYRRGRMISDFVGVVVYLYLYQSLRGLYRCKHWYLGFRRHQTHINHYISMCSCKWILCLYRKLLNIIYAVLQVF